MNLPLSTFSTRTASPNAEIRQNAMILRRRCAASPQLHFADVDCCGRNVAKSDWNAPKKLCFGGQVAIGNGAAARKGPRVGAYPRRRSNVAFRGIPRVAKRPAFQIILALLFSLSLSAAELPRNPFWPLGYEGVRRPISAAPRFPSVQKPLPDSPEAKQAAEKAVKEAKAAKKREDAAARAKAEAYRKAKAAAEQKENELWIAAGKSLRFGGTMSFASPDGAPRNVVTVNGRPYSASDLISANHGKFRFTWRIKAVAADGKIQLERVRCRPLESDDSAK